jgi:DNA polymerase I-like protein with 3'-5' exonuclease and polymerase domains
VLEEIKDYPIVALCGSVALRALFPTRPGVRVVASHYRGNVAHHPDFPGQRFYTLYHPSAILRNATLKAEFRQQMERLARIVAGEPAPAWQVLHGNTIAFQTALQEALAAPLISLDFETTALDSWEPTTRIRSLALTADGRNVLFVHEDESHWIAVMAAVRAYLEQPAKGVVGNNIGFDLDMIEHDADFVVRCTGIHDVGVIWYQAGQYRMPSLKELTAKELDGYRYLVYDPATESDLTLLANYNGEDVVHSLKLFYKGMQLLKPKTRDLVTRVLGPTSLVLRQIQSAGFYLRPDYREAKIKEYAERRRAVIAAWHDEDPEFLPSKHESGNGLRYYLFQIRGLPALHETDKGEPATDKKAIKQWIRNGASYLRHLLELREIDKRLSTNLRAYDKHIDMRNRVHSSYTLTYVDSGRSSSREPNAQNVPRVPDIRDLFGVPPGCRLIEADLNQIEFRIMVCLAQDPTGIAAYNRGEDAHTTTAKQFAENPTKEQRSRAKPVNFSLLYGGSWENVQTTALNDYDLDWPPELCKKFTAGFFDTYKQLPAFHRASRDELIQNRGWFESVLGHIFHYRDWDHAEQGKRDHAFRAALNSKAQGPAAQINFAIEVHARRLLAERGLAQRVPFVNTVHDSTLIEVPEEGCVEPVIATMEEAVGIVYEWVKPWFVVPLVMDYKVGEAWGSLEDYRR